MPVDASELRRGLATTRRYVLSHHEPAEWYRCYRLAVAGRSVRLCARCLGIYPGIVTGLVWGTALLPSTAALAFLVLGPLPALVEWTVTSFTDWRGYNVVRTATGGLLGAAYGVGLRWLFGAGDPRPVAVGLGYGLLAGSLLYYRQTSVGDF